MNLAAAIYETTRVFPREEAFGMTSQMRRAATSIPSNIAEGFGRQRTKPFIQFLQVAQGSLKELETQCLLAARVDLLAEEPADLLVARCEKIGKMLRGLIRALESKQDPK